ncbi:HD domain-containing phosphohydrolase [Dongia rigui]|uniref:PAS domain-containing protein n=1 Tax=Dongia rigui TaxID=940149 RepID=A0ABU5DW09_9PROT|nr:HD domain-containing phosphohydrolase [Dongia rigui]MDY0871162.1 PAS domain-containing protein [Dongia rigui]
MAEPVPGTTPSETLPEETGRKFDLKVIFPAIVLILIAVIGVIAVSYFVDQERQREETQWQLRMGIVADSRFSDVDRWLNRQLDELTGLAKNESLQIYTDQIAELSADATQSDQVEALRDYLRNLLTVTADRTGFALPAPASGDVPANVAEAGLAGLMIIDAKGNVVAASPGAPPYSGELQTFVSAQTQGQRAVSDMALNSRGKPSMAFVVPILAAQTEGAQATQIGIILGVKEVEEEIFPLLKQPGETSSTAKTTLVRFKDGRILYLSPGPDGKPMQPELDASTPNLDTAFAAQKPGAFATDKRSASGERVLVTGRAFQQVPWAIAYTIDYDEALGAAEARFRNLTIVLLLVVGLVGVIIIAVWRHGSSRRASLAASHAQQLATKFESQKNLLQLVTDSQPTQIFILDEKDQYQFANSQAAKAAGIPNTEMIGKPIVNVLGPQAAKRYVTLSHEAIELKHEVSNVARLDEGGKVKVVQSEHIPLKDASGNARSVLTVERDITDVVTERERRARTLNQLVKTLVDVVDKRDPFAAQHSSRVAKVARSVAKEMGLTEVEVETADIAGNLLNLGKILIPSEVLSKTGQLTEAERDMIKNSIQTSADLLQGIEFDGPVVPTLRQAQANWDGTGQPAGLAGDNIVVTARVIAVANAFIGMISDRAFRSALSVDDAIENLMKGAGKAFDRRVVAALVSYIDNHGGRAELERQ